MNKLAIAVTAGAALGAANLASTPAPAMPISNLKAALEETSLVQDVRWICGPFRCVWRPNYYYSYYYAPRVYRYAYAPRVVYSYGYAPAYAYGYGAPLYGYGFRPFIGVGWGGWGGWGFRRW